ncbi:MAG: PadR family transcriptional regulator [Acidimicrobiia bacterium]
MRDFTDRPRVRHEGFGGRRRGGRRRRGDIRTAVLAVLTEEPGHGYEVIQRLEEKTGGAWRPSPGSVYPTLQLLEDEGLARSVERDGKRVYEVTEAGRAESTRRIEEAGGTPWELAGRGDAQLGQAREAIGQLALAMRQVSVSGDAEQLERAVGILKRARKDLYAMLAED